MSITSVNFGAAEELVGHTARLRSEVEEEGNNVIAQFQQLVGGDLQGTAADASSQLGTDINLSTVRAGEATGEVNRQVNNHADAIGNQDARVASQVSG